MVNVSNNFIDQYIMRDSINFTITSLMVSQLAPASVGAFLVQNPLA